MKKTASSGPSDRASKYEEALQRAAGLCSRQEQCSSQIREKLRTWGVESGDAEKIIEKLRKESFLDDRRYAEFYCRDKFRFNGWGRMKITHMLHAKSIDTADIEYALGQIEDEKYHARCLELLRSKSATLREDDAYRRRAKLFRYAAGRGFAAEEIHKALSLLDLETEE